MLIVIIEIQELVQEFAINIKVSKKEASLKALHFTYIMESEKSRIRAKNFSQDEIKTMVDLIEENKASLFGALSSKLTFDDKNQIWEKIAGQISEMHGNIRTKDDISKKWHNTLSKYKPRIADKLASARKTGGGEAEACLDHLEEKISSIKGKEAFERI